MISALFRKYIFFYVIIVFLSEYSFGMEEQSLADKFKNGCIELKDSIGSNKKEVALKTIGLGGASFGAGLEWLKLNEEPDKKVDLVKVIQNNQKFLIGISALGALGGFSWGVHSSATKSANKKALKKDIITLKSKIEKIKIDPYIKDNEKVAKIEIIQELLDEKEKELEELE